MKKICIIGPTAENIMPYADNYKNNLPEDSYDMIIWDRYGESVGKAIPSNKYIYTDSKTDQLHRGFWDYYKFSRFVEKIVKRNNYDFLIVLGLQIGFFCRRMILKHFKEKYILDIRDYNIIRKYHSFDKLVKYSYKTVLSSGNFKSWLPDYDKYLVNHNIDIKSIDEIEEPELKSFDFTRKYIIGGIGSTREYGLDTDLILSLKNSKKYCVNYYGKSMDNERMQKFIVENRIDNAKISGRYPKSEEDKIYKAVDIVNILVKNDTINKETLLPNRLYKAAKFGKPILTFDGNHTAELVKKYDLGLTINSFENLEGQIDSYLNEFDYESYDLQRVKFLEYVIGDNSRFIEALNSIF